VKQYKNFLNHKIAFRCDYADIPKIGSGHLYRSIIIAKFLQKKFSLNPKQIVFIVKTKGKYLKNPKIISNHNFKIISLNANVEDYSKEEAYYLKKIKANLLIIDRLGKVTKTFYETIKNNYKKKIIIDDSSINRKFFDLSLNPLIQNVPSFRYSKIGYKFLILNIFNKKKKDIRTSLNNIFIFFGKFDNKNLTNKVIILLNKINFKLNLILPLSYKKVIKIDKSKHKIIFFESKKYFEALRKSNIAIMSGGISLFDGVLNKKKIICIPQYKHQEYNAKKIAKLKVINYVDAGDKKFAEKIINLFLKIYKDEDYLKKINTVQKRIINIKQVNNTLELISNIYDKSKNK